MNKVMNETMMQYFEWYIKPEDMLWNKANQEAKRLSDIGITKVWLPPAYKGAYGINDSGYAVYDLYDLGEFDQKGTIRTKYGTKEEYIDAIKALKSNNICVYADIVLNHKIGADTTEEVVAEEYSFDNRNEIKTEPIKIYANTVFNFDGRNNTYSDFKWNWKHFHGVDYDALTNTNKLYKFYGKQWDVRVDKEKGNYDFLMGADVDFNNVDVVEELEKWGEWYLNYTHVDGFRLDAVKHIRSTFFNSWLEKLNNLSNEKLNVVGEYWSANLNSLIDYIKQTNSKINLFDVPLHYNFYNASNCGDGFDMRTIFSNTLSDVMPQLAITFVDNHDTQPGQALTSWISDWFKPLAYAVILLQNRGIPCIFYGDFYGISNDGVLPKNEYIEKLIYIRKNFAYGKEEDYFDHRNTIGWIREGDSEHVDSGIAVVMNNGSQDGWKEMKIGINFAGKIMYDYTGNISEEIIVDEKGFAKFFCRSKSVSVWIKKENIYNLNK